MKGENEMALPTTAFYLISHYGAGLPLNRYGSGAYAVDQQFSLYDAASDDQKFKLVTVGNLEKSAHPSFISILCIFLTRLPKKRAQNVLFYPYSGANPPKIWKYSLKWA